MHIDFDVKYTSFLSDFNDIWIFLTGFQKNFNKSNFMKIHLVGAEPLHMDGRTDRNDEAKSRFSQFYKTD
jgi:hypothetical protein